MHVQADLISRRLQPPRDRPESRLSVAICSSPGDWQHKVGCF